MKPNVNQQDSEIARIRLAIRAALQQKRRLKEMAEDPIGYVKMVKKKNHKYYLAHSESEIAKVRLWQKNNPKRNRKIKNDYYHRNAPRINAKKRKERRKRKILEQQRSR